MNYRQKLYVIVFESDTKAGKYFDVLLLILILQSVFIVLIESVNEFRIKYGELLSIFEWIFTIIFCLEYCLRVYISKNPKKYIFSFFGLIDLLSILPSFLGLFITGVHSLLVIRSIRLLRVFRVLKMVRYLGEASTLLYALKASRAKIIVFIGTLFSLTVILGTIMYLIEGGENGFTSIPKSIYWAVVTLTTVGYGDIAPITTTGQIVATIIMVLGYGIIAVPTGIVSAEITNQQNFYSKKNAKKNYYCDECGVALKRKTSKYCYCCGIKL